MLHLTQILSHQTVLKNLASDLYTGNEHIVFLMMLTPQKRKLLLLTSVHKYNLTDLTLEHQLPRKPLMPMYTLKKMKKRIFRLYPWMMLIGLLKKFLTDHYVYMNIHYHMDYASTHVHMQTTRLLPMSRPWN